MQSLALWGNSHSLGKADSLIAHVKFRVELANEDVTQDPPARHLWGKVQAHEAGDALGLALLGDLQDVVPPAQGEGSPVEHEVNIGQIINRLAVNKILARAGNELQASNSSVDGVDLINISFIFRSTLMNDDLCDLINRSDQEAGASVHNSHAVARASHGLPANVNAAHGDLPVAGVAVHLDVGHLSLVVGGVRPTEDHLASNLGLRISAEPEGEHGVNNSLE